MGGKSRLAIIPYVNWVVGEPIHPVGSDRSSRVSSSTLIPHRGKRRSTDHTLPTATTAASSCTSDSETTSTPVGVTASPVGPFSPGTGSSSCLP